ncbi:MAG: ATP-independent RNA helicase DbpA [Planctomycetota bacterium]|jgi:ATP-independent RNA helicase DbpA
MPHHFIQFRTVTSTTFKSLAIKPELLDSIAALEYQTMTPVQAQGLPVILEGKDLLAQAKTGSGKTAAFAIGLLNKIDTRHYHTQAIVLCPTRELADQVSNEIRQLARNLANTKVLTLCGGRPMGDQLASLERSPHIVVGTPGRILKHAEKGSLKLDQLHILVLDEADRMLDMGFHQDIMLIIDEMPIDRQTLLFSATYPEQIKSISDAIQRNPTDIRIESGQQESKIKQAFYQIRKGERCSTLVALLHHHRPESTLVFCNRKNQCQELADELWQQGFHARALHGDLEQSDRDQLLTQFSNQSCSILVATDVAARGLDIKDLPLVVNYDLSTDPEVHIHRIGRTGRAGKSGIAATLFLEYEKFRVEAIAEAAGQPADYASINSLKMRENFSLSPPMVTIAINGGRKDKIRPGDILGALTAGDSLNGKQIGKIDIFDKNAYVAVQRPAAKQALRILSEGKIKGRKFRIRKLG